MISTLQYQIHEKDINVLLKISRCLRQGQSRGEVLWMQAHIGGIVDGDHKRLPNEAEEHPEGNIAQLAVLQAKELVDFLLDDDSRRLQHHCQKGVEG